MSCPCDAAGHWTPDCVLHTHKARRCRHCGGAAAINADPAYPLCDMCFRYTQLPPRLDDPCVRGYASQPLDDPEATDTRRMGQELTEWRRVARQLQAVVASATPTPTREEAAATMTALDAAIADILQVLTPVLALPQALTVVPPRFEAPEATVAALTLALRLADRTFMRAGGSTRHYVRDHLLPELAAAGITVTVPEPAHDVPTPDR